MKCRIPVLQLEAVVQVVEMVADRVNVRTHRLPNGLPNRDFVQHGECARDGLGIESLSQQLPRNCTAVPSASRHASEGM
jgi:hypothetical protein